MKAIYACLLGLTMISLISCEPDNDGIQEVELTLETLDFYEVRLETAVPVRIIHSDDHKVVIRGLERDVYDFDVNVVNDKLVIEEHGNHPTDMLIQVYVDELDALTSVGSSLVYGESIFRTARNFFITLIGSGEIDFAVETDDLFVTQLGSGYVYLEGDVETLDANLEGSGWLRAFDLNTLSTEIVSSGSGSAEVRVESDLDIFLEGSGNVYYKGHPSVTAQITGSGSVIDAN